jgi:NADPH2:quinone reductase
MRAIQLREFGGASREKREVDTGALLRGSKAVMGFWLIHALARPALAVPLIGEPLGAPASGALRVRIGGVYALSEAARAPGARITRRHRQAAARSL